VIQTLIILITRFLHSIGSIYRLTQLHFTHVALALRTVLSG